MSLLTDLFVVSVLTVSDTAATSGPSHDLSGPHIRSLIDQHPSYIVGSYAIVRDDPVAIRLQVKEWAEASGDNRVDWIITTGGTGFGERDQTPQALLDMVSPLPVLSHHLSETFLKKTAMSALSRPIVGLVGRTLLLCLPGSKKACQEGWEAMVAGRMEGVLEHGFKQLRGGSGEDLHPPRESLQLGSSTEGSTEQKRERAGHHHHHHRHHHHHHTHEESGHQTPQPRSRRPGHDVSDRLRQSPFPMITLSEAISLVLRHSSNPLGEVLHRVDHTLRNHILAEDVFAQSDIPATRTTNVDGYAVVAGSTPEGVYKVGKAANGMVPGEVVRVNTGGPLPDGADAVVMVEDTELKTKTDDGAEAEIEVLAQVPVGDNVRQPGSDAKKGDTVLKKGTVIGSGGGEVGLLGFVGKREVMVYRRPVVAILSTGNELVELTESQSGTGPSGTSNGWTGVVDTNRPSLRATLEGLGYEVVDVGIAKDQLEEQRAALERALETADVVVSTGGTSMGEADFLKPLIEHELKGTIHFGRVAMKPGKPTTFATVSRPDGTHKHVFALPGNPASALVTFYLFVLPLLRGLGGWPKERRRLAEVAVELTEDMRLDPREEFHRAIIETSTSRPGVLTARSTGGQRSSRVASLCGANGLVHLPARTEGGGEVVHQGELVPAVIIGELLVGR